MTHAEEYVQWHKSGKSSAAHSTRHMLASLRFCTSCLTHPSRVTDVACWDSKWLPPFQLGRSRQADSSLVPIIEEMMQSHSLVLRNLDVPTHHCGAALDIILATRSLMPRRSALWFHLLLGCTVVLSFARVLSFPLFLPSQPSPVYACQPRPLLHHHASRSRLVIGGCFVPCQSH